MMHLTVSTESTQPLALAGQLHENQSRAIPQSTHWDTVKCHSYRLQGTTNK